MAKDKYTDQSIKSLKGADRVRKRPGVIFGSDGLEGCAHSFFEILSNSIDESREGYGNVIEVVKYKDNSLSVRDYARGIPVEYNDHEQKYNWELVFCELYAGGKYENNKGENYEYSLGLNCLGLCATQYSAEYMDVTIFRDGKEFVLSFKKGENDGGLKKKTYKGKEKGTFIKWRPDLEVFTEIDIPIDYFIDTLKKQAVVNKGVTFKLFDERNDKHYTFVYENGIKDYIVELGKDTCFTDTYIFETETKGRDREDKDDYKLKIQIAFAFSNSVNVIEYYHNSSFLEHGGSPDRAMKNAFLAIVDKFLKDRGEYNKNESKINFVDIQDSLIYISNTFSTVTSYENQTKKAINNKFIQDAITDFLKEKLNIYFLENKTETNKILKQIMVNKRSRENAEKARINLKKKLGSGITVTNRVAKFVDCRTKNKKKRELYIVEGDSALGACKLARDAMFQAIMPVRGKILNCLKADYNKIFDNDIIIDLLKVIGCGVEIKSKHNKELHTFDLDKLNWDKVIICTDADVDGFQIRTLILTMIFTLMPTLIKENKVFIAESPLFEIQTREKTYFAYNQKEKADILKIAKGKTNIQRSKGLGENDPQMMWQTTMNPDSRRLILVEPEDLENMESMFGTLLGDDLSGRKEYIRDNGHEYLDMIDVS